MACPLMCRVSPPGHQSLIPRPGLLERMADIDNFFAEHPAPAADRTIQQALERVRLNIKWLEQNRQELTAWLES